MGRVQGKVAMITGAGSGIGKACTELFAAEGARVFGISRTQAKLDAMVHAITITGGAAAASAADLSRPEDAERAFKAAIDRYGQVDILVNVAGVGYSWTEQSADSMNDIATTPVEKWNEVISINLGSVFHMCRLAVPQMRSQGGGSIVNVGSIFGMIGVPNAHTYTAAKGAVINLTRSLAVTYIKDKIRSNCVCPGFIDTPMIAAVMSLFDDPATAEAASPMGRAGTPMEIANACLFMGSDEASYCNGAVLVVDGGSTAR